VQHGRLRAGGDGLERGDLCSGQLDLGSIQHAIMHAYVITLLVRAEPWRATV
jgi:hypothetical protein